MVKYDKIYIEKKMMNFSWTEKKNTINFTKFKTVFQEGGKFKFLREEKASLAQKSQWSWDTVS